MKTATAFILAATAIALATSAHAVQLVTVTTTGAAAPIISYSPSDMKGGFDSRKKGVKRFADGTVLTLVAPADFNGAKLAGWTINAPTKLRSTLKKGTKVVVPLTEGEYTITADYTTNQYGTPVGPQQSALVFKKGGGPLGGVGRFFADLFHTPDGTKQDASVPVTVNNKVGGFFTNLFGSNTQ